MLVTMACAVQFFSRHGDDVATDLGPWWDFSLGWPPFGERLHRPGPWSVRRSRIRRHHAITRVADTPFPFFPPLNGYHRHILAINNDPAVLALFRDLLEEAGYQVSTQNYVDRDLAQIKALRPDLIVLDYMWANEDASWSLLQMLRMNPITVSIPIVLCTGAVHEVKALEEHLVAMGMTVVLKPFDIDQLVDAIRERLGADRAVRSSDTEG